MLTYQELYEMLRKEKYNEALQPIPKNFLDEAAAYLEEKKAILAREDEKKLFSETLRMTRKQLENTIAMIKELSTIRQRKIVNLAITAVLTGISKRDSENMLKHEEELFEVLVKQLEHCQKELAEKLEGKKESSSNLLIRFTQDVQAFLDAEGKELGPFKRNDVANLPIEIASILIADGKAAKIRE